MSGLRKAVFKDYAVPDMQMSWGRKEESWEGLLGGHCCHCDKSKQRLKER